MLIGWITIICISVLATLFAYFSEKKEYNAKKYHAPNESRPRIEMEGCMMVYLALSAFGAMIYLVYIWLSWFFE